MRSILIAVGILIFCTLGSAGDEVCRIDNCKDCYSAGCEWCSLPVDWAYGLGIGFCSKKASGCSGQTKSKVITEISSSCTERGNCKECLDTHGGWCTFENDSFVFGSRCWGTRYKSYCDDQKARWNEDRKKCSDAVEITLIGSIAAVTAWLTII